MKKYPAYRNSEVEWIGEIPENWKVKKIKWISPVKRGASPRPIDDPKYFSENGDYSWVRIADVSASNRYLLETTQKLSELGASLSVKREPGDFFLSIAGTVGKPIITKIRCCIHDGFVWFPNLKIDPEFLYYIFETGIPYQGLGKWGTQLNLNTDTVGCISIPFPPDIEISNIIVYLDKKTAQIDTLISKKEKLMKLLKEERSAMINQAVTKGLDPDVPMKDSGTEWLGEIPEHWEVKKLSHAFARIGSGTTPESGNPLYYEQGTIPWLNTGDLNDGVLHTTKKKVTAKAVCDYSALKLFPAGSVVIAMYGATIGKTSIVKFDTTMNQACCVFCESDYILNEFLFYFFQVQKNNIINLAKGGGQPNISQDILKAIKLPCPDKNEQALIIQFIDTESARMNKILMKIEQEIDLLKEYKTALISEVVTGKVDVRDEVVN